MEGSTWEQLHKEEMKTYFPPQILRYIEVSNPVLKEDVIFPFQLIRAHVCNLSTYSIICDKIPSFWNESLPEKPLLYLCLCYMEKSVINVGRTFRGEIYLPATDLRKIKTAAKSTLGQETWVLLQNKKQLWHLEVLMCLSRVRVDHLSFQTFLPWRSLMM